MEKSRNTKKYYQWQALVFERDNYKCVKCESDNGLCAHHIIRWDENKLLRYELSNGVTLCRACHTKEHFEDKTHQDFGMSGKNHSDEAKAKMRAARLGVEPWNKGKEFSEETREKMRQAKLGKKLKPFTEEHKAKISAAQKGKKRPEHSFETKMKMSEAAKKRKEENGAIYRGKTWYKCLETGKRIWVTK